MLDLEGRTANAWEDNSFFRPWTQRVINLGLQSSRTGEGIRGRAEA